MKKTSKNILNISRKETSDDIIKVEPVKGKKPTLEEQVRTVRQNRALHLWFRQIAEALNDSGQTPKIVLSHYKMELEWTDKLVKYMLWGIAQERMFNKDSTTKITTKEAQQLEQVVKRFLNEQCNGIDVPFPTVEESMWNNK